MVGVDWQIVSGVDQEPRAIDELGLEAKSTDVAVSTKRRRFAPGFPPHMNEQVLRTTMAFPTPRPGEPEPQSAGSIDSILFGVQRFRKTDWLPKQLRRLPIGTLGTPRLYVGR